MQWKTINIYVDHETGELIDIIRYTNEYYTVKFTKEVFQPKKSIPLLIIKKTHLCKKKPIQTTIFPITEPKKEIKVNRSRSKT